MDRNDLPPNHKRNLRSHRRTVSSNLEDLCHKPQPKPESFLKPKDVPPKEIFQVIAETNSWKCYIDRQQEHEVVRLVKASSQLTLEKTVIMDSFEPQQQNINKFDIHRRNEVFKEPLPFKKKTEPRHPDSSDFQAINVRPFKRKPDIKSNEIVKEWKKKNALLKKSLDTHPVRHQYFAFNDAVEEEPQKKKFHHAALNLF